MKIDLCPPALTPRPGAPTDFAPPALLLAVPRPRAGGGRVIHLGIDMSPEDAAELSDALAQAAWEAFDHERIEIAPTR